MNDKINVSSLLFKIFYLLMASSKQIRHVVTSGKTETMEERTLMTGFFLFFE
jgi:hypothetical protein